MAIGSTVNTAARLESESKKFTSELLVSQEVLNAAGLELPDVEVQEITVRGQVKPIKVYVVKNARLLKPQKVKDLAFG